MEKQIIETDKLPAPFKPYSVGVKVRKPGNIIFIAGVQALDEEGSIVCPGDIKGQMRQVVKNLKVALEAAGATMKDVVKLTTYVTDMKTYLDTKADVEYLSSFDKPAETVVEVKKLATDHKNPEVAKLIEVEAMAVTD